MSQRPLVPPQNSPPTGRQRQHSLRAASSSQGTDHRVQGRPYPPITSMAVPQPPQVRMIASTNRQQHVPRHPIPVSGQPVAPLPSVPRGAGYVYSQSFPPASGSAPPSSSAALPYHQPYQQRPQATQSAAQPTSFNSTTDDFPMAPPPPPPPAPHLPDPFAHGPAPASDSDPQWMARVAADIATAEALAEVYVEWYRRGVRDGINEARGIGAAGVALSQ